jgi:hypothetical protein
MENITSKPVKLAFWIHEATTDMEFKIDRAFAVLQDLCADYFGQLRPQWWPEDEITEAAFNHYGVIADVVYDYVSGLKKQLYGLPEVLEADLLERFSITERVSEIDQEETGGAS